ncbi:MAG: flagellar brake protein [Candidatus Sedimenticola sp. 6PFRAG7]
MTETLSNLQVGDVLQVQLLATGHDERYTCTVIGYVPDKSILVTVPEVGGKVLLMREGQILAVRMLHGSHIKGFMTKIIHVASAPYPYLHLGYPAEVESIAVRNSERVETNIQAIARNTFQLDTEESWQPVLIQDLSMSGAKMLCSESLGDLGDKLEIQFKLNVCGVEETLDLVASLRKEKTYRGELGHGEWRHVCGIEIHHVNRFQKLLLGSYLLETKSGFE